MSADKIKEKILADAKADAVKIIEESGQQADNRVQKIKEQTKLRMAEIEKKAEADSIEIERRSMLTASLDSRKNSLFKRRELLDLAFEQALQKLNEVPDAEYTALITKMIVAASVTGTEKLIVPAKDEKRYKGEKSLITSLNTSLKKAGKTGELSLGGTSSEFSGGVLLYGDKTDVDCSFESLIARFRENEEMEVAKILFGNEV